MTRSVRRLRLAAFFFCLGTLAIACGPGFSEAEPTAAVFVEAPWHGEERLYYEFKQRTNLYGLCEFQTNIDEAAGTTELVQRCIDAEESLYRDDRSVTVDSDTLEPISSERVIVNEKDQQVETKSVVYPADRVFASFLSVSGENEYGATRYLPQPSVDVPRPTWYDDNTLMWLARGIDFATTEELTFTDVNPTTVTVFNVGLLVEGQEDVDVPAGKFQAWKIRFTTKTVTHRVWIDIESPHRVVKAQVENGTYELTGFE